MNEVDVGRTEGPAVLYALWGEEVVLGSCCMKSSDGETILENSSNAFTSSAYVWYWELGSVSI